MNPSRAATPFFFGAASRSLFGWYHAPAAPRRDVGVVVCNPIGDDYVRAHRPLRHLAERLAGAGLAVLRFDFHGTGDSSGDEHDPGRVAAWLDDVSLAVDELRRRSGCARVCLAGLRLGATLATLAAARRGDIDALALWSPYGDGAGFVTEATRLHKMHRMLEPGSFALEPDDWDAGGQEALGFLLTDATVAELRQLDLSRLETRPASRALILGSDSPGEATLAAELGRLGVEVESRPGENNFLVMVPHKASLPERSIALVAEWIVASSAAAEGPPPPDLHAVADGPEEPICFGPDQALFGILSRPSGAPPGAPPPPIILVSAGTVHRIGPHRWYVHLARRFASLGFAVLRVDLSGIGDSAAPAGCTENLCYPRDMLDDVDEAMRLLSARLGAERFVLAGLCSGGDITFQKALADPRVASAVIINPRTFCVNDLEDVETYKRARYWLDALLDHRKLSRLLRGHVDVRNAVGVLLANVKRVWARPRLIGPGGGRVEDVPASLRHLAERGVDTVLVVAAHDPGVEYVDMHQPRQMRSLAHVPGFRRIEVDGTDHTFTSIFAQRLVADLIVGHVAGRYTS